MSATPPPDEPPLPAGHLVGRWRVVRLLGSGGTASVYEAQHVELPRRAALKVLHHRYAYSHEMRARFLREGRAAASVAHPHVVAVHDVGVADDHLFLVMDLLDGESLRDRVRRDGPLPPAALVALFAPLADALAAVHRAGILHRDVSPANVLLVRDSAPTPASTPAPTSAPAAERAVLLDFSSARLDEPSADGPLTRSQSLLGTPAYMSPEHCRGARDLDPRSDVFSLGAVLYLAATGHPPFAGDTWQAILVDVLSGRRTAARARNPALPPALDALIARAMAHEPARRFPDAAALRDALRSLDLRPRSRRSVVLGVLPLAAVALTAFVATAYPAPPPAPPPQAPSARRPVEIVSLASPPSAPPAVTPSHEPAPPVAAPMPPAIAPPAPWTPTRRVRTSRRVPPPTAPPPPSAAPVPPALPRGTNNALILPHVTP